MGNLEVIEFVTLDGVMQGFHGLDERDGFRHSGWGSRYQDEAQFQSAVDALPATGAYLFGRRTYEELAGFWPVQLDTNPMAAHLNRSAKYVATHRTDHLGWRGACRLEGDLPSAVQNLKATVDGNIVVIGSGAVVEQLLMADLVDRLKLFVHPLVLGSGHRLLPASEVPIGMRLDGVTPFLTGVVELEYSAL